MIILSNIQLLIKMDELFTTFIKKISDTFDIPFNDLIDLLQSIPFRIHYTEQLISLESYKIKYFLDKPTEKKTNSLIEFKKWFKKENIETSKKDATKKWKEMKSNKIFNKDCQKFWEKYAFEVNERNGYESKRRICKWQDCDTVPIFGMDFGKPLYCKKHKKDEMINVKNRKCIEKLCITQSNYGIKGEKPLYCSKHKKENMIDVTSRLCIYNSCKIRPAFGIVGEKPLYCKKHKKDRMIDVVNQLCAYNLCKIQPKFGIEGEKPLYCKKHKKDEMINVKNRKCLQKNCGKQPSFGNLGGKKEYCKIHKIEGMVYIIYRKCLEKLCITQPKFGIEGEKPLYCAKHKKKEMIDVLNKKCKGKNCNKNPYFGYIGGKSEYCSKHKKEGMIDVKSKKCEKCGIRAIFGTPGLFPDSCSQHKTSGMISNPRSKCKYEEEKCTNLALFGYSKPLHCEYHKLPDENDLVQKICKTCGLVDIVDKNGICSYHDETLLTKSFLRKQKRVKFLIESKTEYKITFYDKIIDTECNKKRPDIVFDASTHQVILEIDEDQHKSREKLCEETRMKEITQAFGMPCIFIRYNPDDYRSKEGKEIKMDEREKILIKWIDLAMKSGPKRLEEFLRVVYLFYNGFDSKNTSFSNIELPNGF